MEMLVVAAVIIIILGLVIPAVKGLKGSGDMNRAIYDIAGVLEQARAYALANNTYVYVGLGEFDAGKSDSGAQTAGVGRIAVGAAATRDGTRSYSPYTTTLASDWSTNYTSTVADLISTGKLLRYDNLHLLDLDPTLIPTSGSMYRPVVSNAIYRLGNSASVTATPFTYPIGSALTGGNYLFTRVIQFDPQGEARSIPATVPGGNYQSNGVPDYIEIALQPTNGNLLPAIPTNQTSGNLCALQIDGMTGTTVIYRP